VLFYLKLVLLQSNETDSVSFWNNVNAGDTLAIILCYYSSVRKEDCTAGSAEENHY
jgi:hypothetical protein